jgi:hypothetical protein
MVPLVITETGESSPELPASVTRPQARESVAVVGLPPKTTKKNGKKLPGAVIMDKTWEVAIKVCKI